MTNKTGIVVVLNDTPIGYMGETCNQKAYSFVQAYCVQHNYAELLNYNPTRRVYKAVDVITKQVSYFTFQEVPLIR